MPVTARRLVRKMRGGAQSHLLEADDGRFYVVKFSNNPQHRRILVNELVGSVFLRHLEITTPETVLVRVTREFLREHAEVTFELGRKSIPVEEGWHFGSLFPGDPDRVAVYDFVPDALLKNVVNLRDFLGALLFDKWVANANGRQAVFFRARMREWSARAETHPLKVGFLAAMIDQGFAFNGPYWDFPDSPMQGLYPRKIVYAQVEGWDSFQPCLDQLMHLPEEVMDDAYRAVPLQWLNGDAALLEQLLEKLHQRRKRIPDLVADCRKALPLLFPRWK